MSWRSLLVTATLVLTGCLYNQDPSTSTPPLSIRPIVGVNPIIIAAHHNVAWDISSELTHTIRNRLAQPNQLYVLAKEETARVARKALSSHDPFGTDVSWLKKSYPQNEFVVFLELFDHEESALSTAEKSPAELMMRVRVHVFDLRKNEPKIVLQEVVEQSHLIPFQFTLKGEGRVAWGDELFSISPLGLAHEKLCQEIASRIEDYILLHCEAPG